MISLKFMPGKIYKSHFKSFLIILAFVFSFGVSSIYSQTPPPFPPKVQTPPAPPKRKLQIPARRKNRSDIPSEKLIVVDAKVNVKLCVSEGRLKINGWERDEIRAIVAGGSRVGFKILQKSRQSGVPVWVSVVEAQLSDTDNANPEGCLSGEVIELDVPRNAVVSVKSGESETVIDSVGKVDIQNRGGNILLSNIRQGIEARNYEGGITVANSSGAISLATTTGNIVVVDAAPGEIGDAFKAKTNSGAVVLQKIGHRQVEAGSISGSIKFAGEILNGGQYNFKALNGSINLLIPQNSSCKIYASYGSGAFSSEMLLLNIIKSAPSNAQNLSAQLGAGDASLNLSTYSGAIQIKKQ
ncbi:MAG TPA: DUF4097 family beta strand repeat-containing protein [Pyrinomonadaceae bacterium]|nr:DUF4097 family beta strand repeat-containing protein [Pyrinomonadaceae bacterium]